MSNLLFNIRFGNHHFQISKDYKFRWSFNEFHINNPKRFEIITAFGKHF